MRPSWRLFGGAGLPARPEPPYGKLLANKSGLCPPDFHYVRGESRPLCDPCCQRPRSVSQPVYSSSDLGCRAMGDGQCAQSCSSCAVLMHALGPADCRDLVPARWILRGPKGMAPQHADGLRVRSALNIVQSNTHRCAAAALQLRGHY